MKNDRLDSISIAKLGLIPDLKCSKLSNKLVLELRYLIRKHYDLSDERATLILKMKNYLHIFLQILGKYSLMLLDNYGSPDKFLRAHRDTLIEKISKSSRKGLKASTLRYKSLVVAKVAKV